MQITLDLRAGMDNDWGLERLRDTIPRLGPDDGLTLVLDTADADATERLVAELKAHGFDYQPKGADGQSYNIIATRHLMQ